MRQVKNIWRVKIWTGCEDASIELFDNFFEALAYAKPWSIMGYNTEIF